MEIELWPGWRTVKLLGAGSYGRVYEIERDVFGKTEKAAPAPNPAPKPEKEAHAPIKKKGLPFEI